MVPLDPDDNRVIECAISGDCHYIVTGDHHLLALKRAADVQIMNVSDFLSRRHGQSR